MKLRCNSRSWLTRCPLPSLMNPFSHEIQNSLASPQSTRPYVKKKYFGKAKGYHVGRQQTVNLKVSLKECTSCTPPPNVNKAAHSSFKTHGGCYKKSKQGYQWYSKKGHVSINIFKKCLSYFQKID